MSAQLKMHNLYLRGDALLPRELMLVLSSNGNLCAHVFPLNVDSRQPLRTIAFMHRPLSESRLDADDAGRYTLWVGGAGFDVTPDEAHEIHTLLAPLGLQSQYGAAP